MVVRPHRALTRSIFREGIISVKPVEMVVRPHRALTLAYGVAVLLDQIE